MGKITRRKLLKTGVGVGIALPALGSGAYAYGRDLEPHWIEITRHDVLLPNLPPAFDGFRIAQISDFHCDEPVLATDLLAACELTTAQNADIIVFTGDFSSYVHRDVTPKALLPLLQKLHAREGVFGIMGNHDYWGSGPEVLRDTIKQSPLRELKNEIHIFERGESKLYLAGHDDFAYTYPNIKALADQIPAGSASILLGHEPDAAGPVSRQASYGLMLSGHSHGGQICWPGGIPIKLPVGGQKYPRGWYKIRSLMLYTNRGLGTIGHPLRIASRPEISIFTLRVPPENQKQATSSA